MKNLVFFIILLVSGFAQAAVTWEIYPLNEEIRYERNQDQEYSTRQPLDLGFGVSFGDWAGRAEFSSYDVTTGDDFVNYHRQHQEEMLWARREAKFYKQFFISGAAGLGLSQDTVNSKFGNASSGSGADTENLEGLALEGGVLIQKNPPAFAGG